MQMSNILSGIFFYFTLNVSCQFIDDNHRNSKIKKPGPSIKATQGKIWPTPKYQTTRRFYSIIRPSIFKFQVIDHNCDLLEQATQRYIQIIQNQANHTGINGRFRTSFHKKRYCRYLDMLVIKLTKPCQSIPELDMDESYKLVHLDQSACIESTSIWGVLRGLESFSQMLIADEDNQSLRFKETEIRDEPRFSHRGLLIDTSRHYLNIFTIYRIIDGMSYNKLNVLHWHIVDDHSFPYESIAFPELSAKGAYHPTMTYTQKDVQNIIEYARLRGVRVMPEFDTPGHTLSWGASHCELLTPCGAPYEGSLGPIDPTIQKTYNFMQKLLNEIVTVFPEKYIHLGGDEVDFECWASNEKIKQFMKQRNITKFENLEEFYLQRISNMASQLNASTIVWQDVFQASARLPQSTVVHAWFGNRENVLHKITNAGYKVLTSIGWYLDDLEDGGDWEKFYRIDPHDFYGSPEQKKLVLGGEACMWSESVDDTNILQRIFPRVSAVAERLWSHFNESADYSDVLDNAKQRLEEHTCRMILRGIPSQPPNGPGFCV